MRNSGSAILNVFAVAWAAIALSAAHAPLWMWCVPPLVSVLLFILAVRARGSGPALEDGRHIGRLVGIASAVEGVAILVGINLVTWAGRPDLWICVLAAVVGAHFLPLARWMPAARYYLTGAALLLDAALGLVLSGEMRNVVVGGLAAVIVWATAASFLNPSNRVAHSD